MNEISSKCRELFLFVIIVIQKTVIQTFEDWISLSSDVVDLVFDEGACNSINGFVYISSYPNLRSLRVKKNAFKNLNTLTISNNTRLESIVIEDGDLTGGGLQKVRTVVIQGDGMK